MRTFWILALIIPVIAVSGCVSQSRAEQEQQLGPKQICSIDSEIQRFSDTWNMTQGSISWLSQPIDIRNKMENVISGNYTENSTSRSGISFYVFDKKNFNIWRDNGTLETYYTQRDEKSGEFRFVPDHTDTYYFVAEAPEGASSSGTITLDLVWSYDEENCEVVE